MAEQFKFDVKDLDVLADKQLLADNVIDSKAVRSILTFMRRQTPMSAAQQDAQTRYAEYQLSDDLLLVQGSNPKQYFTNPQLPLVLEIGFGMGQSLVAMASANPHNNYLGTEVHIPGLAQCMHDSAAAGLSNLKLANVDALDLLQYLPNDYLAGVQLFFPDPWQKRKHYKRRFVVPERMALVVRKLQAGGFFHAATDWEHYAYWMLEVLTRQAGLVNAVAAGAFLPRPDTRPYTKFEKRGLAAGHKVHDLLFNKSIV